MPFKIASRREFTATIDVMADGADQSFKAVFKVLTDEELEQFDTNTRDGQKAMLRKAVAALRDVVDDHGQPIDDHDAVLEMLLGLSDVRLSLLRAYSLGLVGAKRGN